ncbi:MAG: choice-of-anchor Q domain-containing protein [Verrucomicrobiota bacterium]
MVGYLITCLSILDNTILANNYASTSSSNYFINFSDDGFNFIGSFDYPFCGNPPVPTDIARTVAAPIHLQLGSLDQNRGGIPTHAVLLTCPVLDAGNSFGSTFGVTNDERGAPRPYVLFPLHPHPGDGSDIGAFELGSATLGLGMMSNDVVVSWPAYDGDFVLQSATNLQGSSNWSTVTDALVVVGNRFNVTNHITGALKLYRLINQ